MQNVFGLGAYSPPFPYPLSSFSFNIIKCQIYKNQNSVEEKLLSSTDENREKRTLYIFGIQMATVCLWSNVPLVYV